MSDVRICGDLGSLADHLQTFTTASSRKKSPGKCAYCGVKTYTKCTICDVYLHNFPVKGQYKDADMKPACSIHWHDKARFGMAKNDTENLRSKQGMRWKEPSAKALEANKQHIDHLSIFGGSANI